MLRALREAGVKIDVIGAHGIGSGAALLAAVDGGARLWDPGGLWRDRRVRLMYALRPSLRAAWSIVGVGCALVAVPLLVMITGLLAYPLGFGLQLVSPATGQALIGRYTALVDRAFQPDMLPTLVPRLALLLGALLLVVIGAAAMREGARQNDRRRERNPWWGRVLAAPYSTRLAVDLFRDALWKVMRGASRLKQPSANDLGRRYLEVLTDGLGQPGFRELILVAHDLDARHDLVFALLADSFRQEFLRYGPSGARGRSGEVMDLAGVGREHVLDALSGALSLPVWTDAHALTFGIESVWRGETHRICDRPGIVGRLLDEVAAAGVQQVLIASAASERSLPHGLVARSLTFRARFGEYLAGDEAASIRDALAARASLFQSVFQIAPAHNPVGPLDFGGSHDERSDRTYPLAELIDRGYQDAYHQFIEPIVGAEGERLGEKKKSQV